MSKPYYLVKEQNFQRWFPPHMSRGLEKMRINLRRVDCVVEVHDARIPISGRNPVLKSALSSKPRVVVLNKVDLVKVTEQQVERIFEHYKREGIQKLLFTKCSQKHRWSAGNIHKSIEKVIPTCVDLVYNSDRYDRECENDINVMVIGVPNVGKSSLLNDIRQYHLGLKKPVAGVGKAPGHTKSVSFKTRVCDNPPVYLLDTPGIFQAKINNMNEGMKLAVCNTVHDHIMGAPMVAEYLLLSLNENAQREYVIFFGLEEPTDCIRTVLKAIAKKYNLLQRYSILTGTGRTEKTLPNYDLAAMRFLDAYREGHIGKFVLDRL